METRIFPAQPSSLFDIREFIRGRSQEAALAGDAMNDLVLAVSEACANAVLHSGTDSIVVKWESSRGVVRVEVVDHGVFQRHVPLAVVDDRQGHGIPLMIALVDEVDIREGTENRPGTVVRLVKFMEA